MNCTGWRFVFVANILAVTTLKYIIISQQESDIERLKTVIFELNGDIKLLRMQLKECSEKLQEQVGYYDEDGNYVERD